MLFLQLLHDPNWIEMIKKNITQCLNIYNNFCPLKIPTLIKVHSCEKIAKSFE